MQRVLELQQRILRTASLLKLRLSLYGLGIAVFALVAKTWQDQELAVLAVLAICVFGCVVVAYYELSSERDEALASRANAAADAMMERLSKRGWNPNKGGFSTQL